MDTAAKHLRLARPLPFDIASAQFKRDPFPTFARMRAAGEVIPMKLPFIGRTWVTTTYAAAEAMVKDNQRFVQEGKNAGRTGFAGMRWWMPKSLLLIANNMLLKDEPDHRRLRQLVNQAFQRREVQAMRGEIDKLADSLLDEAERRGDVDLVRDYARRLPLEVIAELLGLPKGDRSVFTEMARAMVSITNAFGIVRAARTLGKMTEFVRAQIAASKAAPRPGLLHELVEAEEGGHKLSEDELVSMVFLLLTAGSETTTHLISGGVIALVQNPEQRAYLMADPAARIERSVEELLRYVSAVQSTKPRFVAQGGPFFGADLAQGDLIIALVAAANADPARFDEPHALKLDRFPNPHLSFGSGIHFCLGMQLARVEAQSAITRLFARYPRLTIPPAQELDYFERFGMRGVKTLPAQLRD